MSRSLCDSNLPRHLVITGAPGNGKSTLTRFVAQYYRADFLKNDIAPGMIADIAAGISEAMSRLELRQPLNSRWPLYVKLTDVADSGLDRVFPFLRWAATDVSNRTDDAVSAGWLKQWMQTWPWLIIFDGLDEVTSIAARQRVIEMIDNFRDQVDTSDADVLIVVTTRPTGYSAADRLPVEHFEQLDLAYLQVDDALAYGEHLTRVWLSDDPDRAAILLGKMKAAVTDEASMSLTRTPLQILIMTIILERLGQLPTDRYQLFWGYFETIYSREAAKPLSHVAVLLTDHRPGITAIHTRVGLELQHRAETEGEASAVLSEDRFESLIREYLVGDLGYTDDYGFSKLVRQLGEAAMTRLVLLGPKRSGIGFEIRPLQELMAARALSDTDDATLTTRLRALAPSPHWRNTWLFMAGRTFSDTQPHRWDLVADCVAMVDSSGAWPGWLCPIGPVMASQLLEEGIALDKPRWSNRFLDVSLRSLAGPVNDDFTAVRSGLKATATRMPGGLERIRGAMAGKGNGPSLEKQLALMLWSTNDFGGQILGWTRISASVLEDLAWNDSPNCEQDLGSILKSRAQSFMESEKAAFDELGSLARIFRRTLVDHGFGAGGAVCV